MILAPLQLNVPQNPIHDLNNEEEPKLDDDMTVRLQSRILPLEVQLMLDPMWTVRSKFNDCMRPLDTAMEQYLKFRSRLKEIDLQIELGKATNFEIATAFEEVLRLVNVYEKNQKDLQDVMKEVNHQILAFANASKNDLMWNEMLRLREIDYVSYTQKTCTFEHVVTCLFRLDENLKESIRSSVEISKCCVNYLLRISQHFNFANIPHISHEDSDTPSSSTKVELSSLLAIPAERRISSESVILSRTRSNYKLKTESAAQL